MALEFRRGKEAIASANESSKSGGNFSPFLPNFYWKDHEQSRLLWILNPIEDIPLVRMVKPYTKDRRVELVVARQDDAIGESNDPIEDQWGYGPADTNVCVAVELKAVMEVRHGRERPTSFEVETRDFTRRVRDAKGELTEEKEDATAPSVGVICQSPNNFFNHLSTKDTTIGPIHQFPLQIVRSTPGDAKDTDYEIEMFEERPLDMSGLLDNWEDISYFTEDEKDEVADLIEQAEDDDEIAVIIGTALLNKWLNEHATEEFYNSVLNNIDTPAKYPSKKYQEAKGGAKAEKTERPARTSQRRSRRSEEPAVEDAAPDISGDDEPEAEVEKPKRRSRRTKVEETPAEEETPAVSKTSPIKERMEKLREETERRAKEKAAKAA